MSNSSLKKRLIVVYQAYLTQQISLRDLAKEIELHAKAFEKMGFLPTQQIQSIFTELEDLAYFADEGFEHKGDLNNVLSALDLWISQIPT